MAEPKLRGKALHFANYSSSKMLMGGVRDVIGPTLLKDLTDRTALTCPCEKRDPGYSAAIDASITLVRT